MKKAIATTQAPGAIGPYSQGVALSDLIFTSGQLGLDPATGEFVGGVEAQTKQALRNVQAILEEAGSSLNQVIKTTVFLKDLEDFATMNSIYSMFFVEPYPARSAVEVARLPKDGLVEIEVIALRK
ncbi:2-iminobutanoate/2-iminopropanoate deaminase [Paenibacillus shirakamiensis]|uniref:2-iminobutanoate/2-iminopropanoate deaminase n=1 Tax=Paenibacillus shirakamiensis TaxID=1265935 RepID=A0ABS4JIW2_9BACL|nr:RidA family protein [Paenibacillus shirakamiensis]MBP2001633.1 2-iminobutanoate/2-iminopropanoate deaminase [Paenibacillus shirakamiensis]